MRLTAGPELLAIQHQDSRGSSAGPSLPPSMSETAKTTGSPHATRW